MAENCNISTRLPLHYASHVYTQQLLVQGLGQSRHVQTQRSDESVACLLASDSEQGLVGPKPINKGIVDLSSLRFLLFMRISLHDVGVQICTSPKVYCEPCMGLEAPANKMTS